MLFYETKFWKVWKFIFYDFEVSIVKLFFSNNSVKVYFDVSTICIYQILVEKCKWHKIVENKWPNFLTLQKMFLKSY